MRVGFVGAGRMGGPMVARLVEAGHDVDVLCRSDQRCAAMANVGARPVVTLSDVARDADAVVVCVFTDEQVIRVCVADGLLAAMPARSILVLHTTGSPQTARELAASAPAVGVVDAPVSGGPHDIAAGRVTLFVGGSDDDVQRASPVLGSYADPILHAGATGAGQLVKLVNNTLFAAQIGLVAEATRLGAQFGVDEGALLTALTRGSAQSRVLDLIAASGSARAFVTAVGEFIGKDVALVRRTVAELGADLGVLDAVIAAGDER